MFNFFLTTDCGYRVTQTREDDVLVLWVFLLKYKNAGISFFVTVFVVATELNPFSHLLALLGARPKVDISRIKVEQN